MELRGRSVIVVGLGKSGIAAARLCLDRGARVLATDSSPPELLSDDARSLGIEILRHEEAFMKSADVIVVSPGVPPLPQLDELAQRGVEVIGELDLASRFVKAPIVAVGGTNGKSTTTTALAAIFEAAGKRVFAGGNLGTPLSDAVGSDYDVLVVEVSSFQLERAPVFCPKVSILLNVTEDHLDRYVGLLEYAQAKGNAFANQTPRDVAIVPTDDWLCRRQAERGHARVVTFGDGGDYATVGRSIVEQSSGTEFSVANAEFHGRHNLMNAAAAVAAARSLEVEPRFVELGLLNFRPLGHRMARVAQIDGVTYFDDSKATNVGAAVTALLGLEQEKAVLIAGGRDKLGSYEPLVRALESKGRAVVAIGEAAERILEAIGGRVRAVQASSMEEAVERARELAQPGDAVLLSPACSSFDWFSSYAERGDRFVAAVVRLQAGMQP